MRALWYTRTGPAAEVLCLGEQPDPVAAPGQVLVRLHASGVNPADCNRRSGRGYTMEAPLVIPHSDGAGVVEAVGEGVDRTWTGRRVWLYNGQRALGRGRLLGLVPSGLEHGNGAGTADQDASTPKVPKDEGKGRGPGSPLVAAQARPKQLGDFGHNLGRQREDERIQRQVIHFHRCVGREAAFIAQHHFQGAADIGEVVAHDFGGLKGYLHRQENRSF